MARLKAPGAVGVAFAAVPADECRAPRWCNLADETGHDGIPRLDGLRLGLRRIDGGPA